MCLSQNGACLPVFLNQPSLTTFQWLTIRVLTEGAEKKLQNTTTHYYSLNRTAFMSNEQRWQASTQICICVSRAPQMKSFPNDYNGSVLRQINHRTKKDNERRRLHNALWSNIIIEPNNKAAASVWAIRNGPFPLAALRQRHTHFSSFWESDRSCHFWFQRPSFSWSPELFEHSVWSSLTRDFGKNKTSQEGQSAGFSSWNWKNSSRWFTWTQFCHFFTVVMYEHYIIEHQTPHSVCVCVCVLTVHQCTLQ